MKCQHVQKLKVSQQHVLHFFPFMYCQGSFLGLATNTTIKCSKFPFTKCPAGQNNGKYH